MYNYAVAVCAIIPHMMKYRNRHVVVLCSLFAVCGLVRAGDALPLVDLSGETNRHVVVAAVSASPVFAEIKMGAPFTDGVVLQRGMKVPVWGRVTTSGGASIRRVKVEFASQSKTADVGADGSWKVELDPMEASKESRVMTVSGMPSGGSAAAKVEVKDVLVGEVWFASGQSNMECPIWGPGTRYRDMKGGMMTTMTRLPYVRYVKPERNWSVKPREFSARWCKFTPENLQIFHRDASFPGDPGKGVQLSAVAFYFARELYLALDVPVGIVNSSWGGTNIDAWTPRCGYEGSDKSIRATAEYEVKAKWKSETDRKGPVGGPHQQPTVLYNGMVSAFAPMAMRGLIWYQGCHNSREPGLYCAKLHALYEGWRREFANDGLRIYLVQLAPYKDNWPGMCAAQNKFVSEEKNAAIAVVSDAGNFDDIHPNDKEIVAKRLVVHALKRDYGFAIPEDDSPVFRSATFGDGRATVSFDHVKDWYVYAPRHSRSPAFELAGADGKWYPAKILNYRTTKDKDGNQVATDFIDGSSIVLESEGLADPVKVRYMGRPRTSGILYNEASLPLGPFESM